MFFQLFFGYGLVSAVNDRPSQFGEHGARKTSSKNADKMTRCFQLGNGDRKEKL